jgi:hypothetical protein
MAFTIVMILAALAATLSLTTIGRSNQQTIRQNEVRLLAAVETATAETLDWMHSNPALLKALATNGSGRQHPELVVIGGQTLPWYDQWEKLANPYPGSKNIPAGMSHTIPQVSLGSQITSADVLDSANLPGGVNPMFPVITMATTPTATTVPGQSAGLRNNCAVRSWIVCLTGTGPAPAQWPDGHEKFLVFTTAVVGDLKNDPNHYERRMVQAVISTSPTKVFNQCMYAESGYTVTGSAGTDSWAGPGTTYSTASGAISTWPADRQKGDISSGGSITVGGAAKIAGKVTPNTQVPLPQLVYSVPAGYSEKNAITSSTTLSTVPGGNANDPISGQRITAYHASTVTGNLTIDASGGSGTVYLYVDGPINFNTLTFNPKSTTTTSQTDPKLVIVQNNYDPSLGPTAFTPNNYGDVTQIGNGNNPDFVANPERLTIMSNYASDISMNANGQMAAVIFAPYANIKMKGTFNFFGSIIADSFDSRVNGTFNFHYDNNLGNIALPVAPQITASGWNTFAMTLGNYNP